MKSDESSMKPARASGVSAAEKYAELEARGEERPIGSNGLPMRWNRLESKTNGGRWVDSKSKRTGICFREVVIDGIPFCKHGSMYCGARGWQCSEKQRESKRRSAERNREQKNARQRTRRVLFGEEIRAREKILRVENKERNRERQSIWSRKKYDSDPIWRLSKLMKRNVQRRAQTLEKMREAIDG